ncbi:unnamed protein product [marine sediment metagenome]|uniref:Uncharacterized protein n=1 Tax=marine sediment metagenome TaxID=412755 RepID=X1BF56_9ZZZZ
MKPKRKEKITKWNDLTARIANGERESYNQALTDYEKFLLSREEIQEIQSRFGAELMKIHKLPMSVFCKKYSKLLDKFTIAIAKRIGKGVK